MTLQIGWRSSWQQHHHSGLQMHVIRSCKLVIIQLYQVISSLLFIDSRRELTPPSHLDGEFGDLRDIGCLVVGEVRSKELFEYYVLFQISLLIYHWEYTLLGIYFLTYIHIALSELEISSPFGRILP